MLIPGFKNRAALLVGGILLSSLLAACAGGGPSAVPSGGQEPNTTRPAPATEQGVRSMETSLAASGIRVAAADRAAVATAKTRVGHMYFPYNKYWSKRLCDGGQGGVHGVPRRFAVFRRRPHHEREDIQCVR